MKWASTHLESKQPYTEGQLKMKKRNYSVPPRGPQECNAAIGGKLTVCHLHHFSDGDHVTVSASGGHVPGGLKAVFSREDFSLFLFSS